MPKQKSDFIYSQERRGHWIPLVIGLLCILVSIPIYPELLRAWERDDYLLVLMLLLFPLVGVGMLLSALNCWRNYRYFGPSPLRLDPVNGQAGGQAGGEILLNHYWRQDAYFNVKLICLKRRRITHRSKAKIPTMLWQQEQAPYGESRHRGTSLRFCFDLPESVPISLEEGRIRIYWNLVLKGTVAGRHLYRSWEIPVEKGTMRCSRPLPKSHLSADQRQRALNALEAATQQVHIEPRGSGVKVISRAGRNLGMNTGLLIFGSLFAGGATWILMGNRQGGVFDYMGYVIALVFGGIGLTFIGAALWMLGRSLHASIQDGQITSQRRWLGFPIGQAKAGQLQRANQLALTSNSRSGHGEDTVEMMTLTARDDNGARIRIAESIAGREVGDALKQALIESLALSEK